MRDLKYHVACTVDGFIAHEDGSVEGFLDKGEHVTEYLESLRNDYDVVLMGRKTYEFGLQFGVTDPYPWMKQYVFSRAMRESPHENVELVSDGIAELVGRLKSEPGKSIYLCGGAGLATTLLADGLVDEVILKLNPVLFGSGIPLFHDFGEPVDLHLAESKAYGNGVLLLRYRLTD